MSRSSLYYQPLLPYKDWQLKCQIEAVLEQHRDYGYRRVAQALTMNKKPVLVKKDIAGFLANRIQHALMREALSLIDAGIATPANLEALRRRISGSRLEFFEGGHGFLMQDAQAYAGIVEFLSA